jgi:hypothetical protein
MQTAKITKKALEYKPFEWTDWNAKEKMERPTELIIMTMQLSITGMLKHAETLLRVISFLSLFFKVSVMKVHMWVWLKSLTTEKYVQILLLSSILTVGWSVHLGSLWQSLVAQSFRQQFNNNLIVYLITFINMQQEVTEYNLSS